MNIKELKDMIVNQPDDEEVSFFTFFTQPRKKIIFKVGKCGRTVDLGF